MLCWSTRRLEQKFDTATNVSQLTPCSLQISPTVFSPNPKAMPKRLITIKIELFSLIKSRSLSLHLYESELLIFACFLQNYTIRAALSIPKNDYFALCENKKSCAVLCAGCVEMERFELSSKRGINSLSTCLSSPSLSGPSKTEATHLILIL